MNTDFKTHLIAPGDSYTASLLIEQIHQLRYKVFVEEGGKKLSDEEHYNKMEFNEFDKHAHYIAVTHKDRVVGTYRLMTRKDAKGAGGFYTETEFNISNLKRINGDILELSRTCIAAEYRKSSAFSALWKAVMEYILDNNIYMLIGMPSFPNSNPTASCNAISHIHENYLGSTRKRPEVRRDVPKYNSDILPSHMIDTKLAKHELPPIYKLYLSLGGKAGAGIALDLECNTLDVCMFLETYKMSKDYQKHYLGNSKAFSKFVPVYS